MSTKNLLVELFVEELPPKALKTLGESFAQLIGESLKNQGLLSDHSAITSFATPRRLAARITTVADRAASKAVQQKLMPVNVALDAGGQPTQALLKKLAAMGFDINVVSQLKRAPDGKAEALFLDTTIEGATLAAGLQTALDHMLSKLPIPKVMSYQLADGWNSVNFVRPAHGLIAVYGNDVVDVSILGLKSGRVTQGHRFEAKQAVIEIKSADNYAAQLMNEGAVIASYAERRASIVTKLEAAAKKAGLTPIQDEALLDEVTSLVERPNVLTCQFESEFLQVPQECLILTMKANQKYFPLLDSNGKLSNKFLVVSNISPADASKIIEGNERVVRPRLADAKFFFEQDRKHTLESRRERLGSIVYHNKLGSVLDRSERVSKLARRELVSYITGEGYNDHPLSYKAQRASELAKADLVTNMVGEFPELQGTMGRYYALADNADREVAEAIREQYLPRGAGDELPKTQTGIALSLADKIDTIAGVFAIDQKPTGTKDPFGVRRAAIGILRIIIERKVNVNLEELISIAVSLQPVTVDQAKVANEIYDYIMERLRGYYVEASDSNLTTEMFDAVLANRPKAPLDFHHRLHALQTFLQLPDAQSLAAANKRIANILKKSGQEHFGAVNAELLNDPAEQVLHEQIVAMAKVTEPLFAARDYTAALTKLASLRKAVDAFFDGVMVMADDLAIRNNRLALLSQLRELFVRVADLSRLPG
jgi:glycyl-tRNA synthetase beta chain